MVKNIFLVHCEDASMQALGRRGWRMKVYGDDTGNGGELYIINTNCTNYFELHELNTGSIRVIRANKIRGISVP